jgi:signal transduction histidine kinase
VGESDKNELARLTRRYERERAARQDAESIAERVTRELYASVQELKRLNVELEQANLELEAANQTIRDFVAVAAHDMRGPLSAVLGFSSKMLQKWETVPDANKRDYLGIIERQSQHMARMLDNLLTVSRIEAGALELHKETIEVAHAIDHIVEEFGERFAGVVVHCPPGVRVVADPDHFQRILVNYISNAVKYGGPPVEVDVRDGDDWVELAVKDQGEGIPKEFVPRLFQKFARAETEDTRREMGTGLGLSIVSGLAHANSGEAWYEVNHPKGSCFAVRFPKRAA